MRSQVLIILVVQTEILNWPFLTTPLKERRLKEQITPVKIYNLDFPPLLIIVFFIYLT